MDYKYLKVDNKNKVSLIEINNPPVNVMSADVLLELEQYIDSVNGNEEARALVISGGEGKAFCAGADIKGFFDLLDKKKEDVGGRQIYTKIAKLNIPVIAAVNGLALGGGFELALACHFRFAAKEANFALPEVGLGIIPGWGGTQRLSRIVGISKALDIILTSKYISATEAADLGIVDKVTTKDKLIEESMDYAQILANKAPVAVQTAVHAVLDGYELPIAAGLDLEGKGVSRVFSTEDAREGATAFVEKREAVFKGK